MSELINNRKVFSLLEVTGSIEKTLSARYASSFWVKAELLKLNHYPKSGHCYPDLVEKLDGTVVAQIRANLWKDDFQQINQVFLEVTKEPLKDGINILLNARINYHPVHGLALQILDIDPNYTLGDMIREKLETIRKLKEEQIFDRNKSLKLPLLPKRIAVISAVTSKGYSDFRNKIDKNPFGYRFFYMLFPSLLQGDRAVKDMLKQLACIRKVKDHFDVVAIIRGGGGDVGLNCYDNYKFAKEIALFPLPVLTGIGHSTNETVVQMVAYKNNITPTDVADFLIQQFHNYSVVLEERQRKIIEFAKQILKDHSNYLMTSGNSIIRESKFIFDKSKQSLTNFQSSVRNNSVNILRTNRAGLMQQTKMFIIQLKNLIHQKNSDLNQLENHIRMLDPKNVLKRGYSITRLNNKAILSPDEVIKSDILVTELYSGKIKSIVESSNKLPWKKRKHIKQPSKNLKRS
ncbi:MAG: exodeoxyribonuclease VII large subunit [Bacteroidota bacterium]|nr:exodeoxyribonuclease VII large subunit [Bacteroidota bacterium]